MLAYSAKTRSTALLGLGAFLVVSVTTTVLSLGVYCLTRYASLPFMFFPVAVAG